MLIQKKLGIDCFLKLQSHEKMRDIPLLFITARILNKIEKKKVFGTFNLFSIQPWFSQLSRTLIENFLILPKINTSFFTESAKSRA